MLTCRQITDAVRENSLQKPRAIVWQINDTSLWHLDNLRDKTTRPDRANTAVMQTTITDDKRTALATKINQSRTGFFKRTCNPFIAFNSADIITAVTRVALCRWTDYRKKQTETYRSCFRRSVKFYMCLSRKRHEISSTSFTVSARCVKHTDRHFHVPWLNCEMQRFC